MVKNTDIARFHDLDSHEMHPIVERALAEQDEAAREMWVALFRNRALKLIRKGSSIALGSEAAALNRHLNSSAGRAVREADPSYYARLATIADMLTVAGQRTDSVFLSAVLSSHGKYARSILEMLADAGDEGLPRRALLDRLKVSESHLSHILRDLEEADVVIRFRRPGLKEVRVALGHAGRDLISERLLPAWFTTAEQLILDATRGAVPDHATVAEALQRANVPSRLLVGRIKDLVSVIASTKHRRP